MKKLFLLMILSYLPVKSYSQKYNSDSIYISTSKKYDSLQIKSESVDRLEKVIYDYDYTMNKLLISDNYKNVQKRKDIIGNFNEEHLDKKITLTDFNSSSDIENYFKPLIDIYKLKSTKYKLKEIMFYLERKSNDYENYLIQNLIRLKISVSDYNKMSEQEKEALWKTFK